jgi:hypothetical protein
MPPNRYEIVPSQRNSVARYSERERPVTFLSVITSWVRGFFRSLFGLDARDAADREAREEREFQTFVREVERKERIALMVARAQRDVALAQMEAEAAEEEREWRRILASLPHAERIRRIQERTREQEAYWDLDYVTDQRLRRTAPPARLHQPASHVYEAPPDAFGPASSEPRFSSSPAFEIPLSPPSPKPAVETAMSDEDVKGIAMRILFQLHQLPPEDRNEAWEDLRTKLTSTEEALLADEIIRQVEEMWEVAQRSLP